MCLNYHKTSSSCGAHLTQENGVLLLIIAHIFSERRTTEYFKIKKGLILIKAAFIGSQIQ